ncbi:antirestriction protein, partial [Serratia sp. PGPR-27]|uniref:antirestriction protein n=1 Tax=Serratia sp. PGPR-27 TaxID=2923365 RepID=UPI001F55E529
PRSTHRGHRRQRQMCIRDRTYSHHACRTECDAMTEHYYRLRDYALSHPESNAIMRIID